MCIYIYIGCRGQDAADILTMGLRGAAGACYIMLCYAMLCYAMLCYAMLCYAMLCYAMQYYDTIYYTIS